MATDRSRYRYNTAGCTSPVIQTLAPLCGTCPRLVVVRYGMTFSPIWKVTVSIISSCNDGDVLNALLGILLKLVTTLIRTNGDKR